MKLSSVNLNNISLYLKYGIISFPNLSIKKEKKRKLNKIKNINFNKSTYNDIFNSLLNSIDKQIKKSKKNNEKVVLFLSSGLDSRLLYYIIYYACKQNKYLKNFYTLTGDIKYYGNKYSEFKVLKKNFRKKIHNHKVIDIIYNNFEDEVKESCKINQKPINGLPIITMKKLFDYCSKNFTKKLVITGIGDPIFFNADNEIIKNLKQKRSIQYASDGIIYRPNDFLSQKYNYISNRIFKSLKFKELFKINNFFHEFINKQYFFLKGPKVKNEVLNLSRYFRVKTFSPFYEKDLIKKILGLPVNLLFNGVPKSFIYETLKIIDGTNPKQGLKMNSPQREFIFEKYKKNVIKIIKNSTLEKLKIVNSNKLYKSYLNQQKCFFKKKNKKTFNNISSYEIWKFISTELFLRGLK